MAETFNFPEVSLSVFLDRLEEDMRDDIRTIKKQRKDASAHSMLKNTIKKKAGLVDGAPITPMVVSKLLQQTKDAADKQAPSIASNVHAVTLKNAALKTWATTAWKNGFNQEAALPDTLEPLVSAYNELTNLLRDNDDKVTAATCPDLFICVDLIGDVIQRMNGAMLQAGIDANAGSLDRIASFVNEYRVPSPMLAIGKAGIGKTEGVRGIAKKLGIGFMELRLCNYTETDLVGVPYITEDHSTAHAKNTLLPTVEKDGEFGILLVDEFTSTMPSVQVPILQLTDSSRGVGNYKLPAGWKIVLAGNGPDDGGTFINLPGTVISRAACYYVKPADDWAKGYATRKGVHPTIIAYILNSPGSLHAYDTTSDSEYDRAFPCPRSWAALSDALYDLDLRAAKSESILNDSQEVDYSAIRADPIKYSWAATEERFNANRLPAERIVASRIGVNEASKFIQFVQNQKEIVNPQEIMAGTAKTKRETLSAAALYLTATALVSTMTVEMETKYKNAYTADLKESSGDMTDDTLKLYDKEYVKMVTNVFRWLVSDYGSKNDLTTRMDQLAYIVSSIGPLLKNGSALLQALQRPIKNLRSFLDHFYKLN